ncbi:MAG: response regulator [Campylobacterales bacterium]
MDYIQTLNVLIVEDEYISASFLEDVLYGFGVKSIEIVSKYQEALEIVKKNHIDVAFMDINLNEPKSGIECAREINKRENTPIIYITAYKDSDTIKRASETNIYGYLCKPFDKKDVEIALGILKKQLSRDKSDVLIALNNYYTYNLKTALLAYKNEDITLTKKESMLLKELVINLNHNVPYDTIRLSVWGSYDVSESALRDTVLRIRKKAPELNIQSNIGFGYILKA